MIQNSNNFTLVLLDIRSVQNVASLFRTCDCAGIKEILLVGTTPTPIDRFGRPRSDFIKISLGAEKTVLFKYFKNTEDLINYLKLNDYKIIALEQNDDSIDYKEFVFDKSEKTVLVLGNEVEGIPSSFINHCNHIVEIPIFGKKESLNVSIAGAIAIFRILNI